MDDTRPITLQPPLWMPLVLLLAVGMGGGFYVYGKTMETEDRTPPMVTVTGEGKVSASPDIAELSFGVTVQRKATAKQAMEELGKKMQAVFEATKAAGIDEKDIRTENLSLNPAYDWREGQQIMRGFDASQSLHVKVRAMDTVSDVLAAATNAGANQAGGVSFVIDDPEKARAEARQEAIEQAQQKAVVLARQLGLSLGELKSFNEGGGYNPPMPMMARGGMAMAESMDMAQTVPLPAGEQDIQVQVSLTYELK